MVEIKFSCMRQQKKSEKEEKDYSLGIKSEAFDFTPNMLGNINGADNISI